MVFSSVSALVWFPREEGVLLRGVGASPNRRVAPSVSCVELGEELGWWFSLSCWVLVAVIGTLSFSVG